MDQALPPLLPRNRGVSSSPSSTSSSLPPPFPTTTPRVRASTLEELLDDCFQVSIGQDQSFCSARAQYAASFDKHLTSLHCHENLAFLMEIFKYEYFYDKVFPENLREARSRVDLGSPLVAMSSSFLNQSLLSAIDTLPFPTKQMCKKSRRYSSRSRASLISVTPSEPNVFDFGFEDSITSGNVWDKLKESHVDSSDLEPELDLESEYDNNTLLADQWAYIMKTFVQEDSPQQLNLANLTVKDLLEKDSQDVIHNPAVLFDARQEIIQLLRENAYGSFVAMHKSNSSSKANSVSASRAHSRPQSPPTEDPSFFCNSANCCQSNRLRLPTAASLSNSSTASGIKYSNISPASGPKNLNCQSFSPLHHPRALKKVALPTSPLAEQRNSISDLFHEVVSPVPVVKRKTPKFFLSLGSTPSDSSASDFSISSIISHFKSPTSGTPTNSRSINTSHPQTTSALSSGLPLPAVSDTYSLRPSSTLEAVPQSLSHSHRLGKLWRRRK